MQLHQLVFKLYLEIRAFTMKNFIYIRTPGAVLDFDLTLLVDIRIDFCYFVIASVRTQTPQTAYMLSKYSTLIEYSLLVK